MWLILGFHPVWERAGIARILRKYTDDASGWPVALRQADMSMCLSLRLAWRSVRSSLQALVRRLSFYNGR